MKTALVFTLLLLATLIVSAIILGIVSRSGSPAGLVDGRLARCPQKPNCVCSEYPDATDAWIAPLPLGTGGFTTLMPRIRDAVTSLGGKIGNSDDLYLAATFSSSLFGFVDDLELRIDPERRLLHLRSASRVGYSDLGINRKRVEHFKQQLISRLQQPR